MKEDAIDKILEGLSYGSSPKDAWWIKAKSSIEALIREAYREGYNDNARDCSCDKFSVKPHHHLMDDGKSHRIIPKLKGADK